MNIGMTSQVAQVVKKLPASAGDEGDMGSVFGSGRFPGGGNATHSCGAHTWMHTCAHVRAHTHTHTHTRLLDYGDDRRQIIENSISEVVL